VFDLLGSRDVIGQVTIWFPVCYFLLVVLWNQTSICNSFQAIQHQWLAWPWCDL